MQEAPEARLWTAMPQEDLVALLAFSISQVLGHIRQDRGLPEHFRSSLRPAFVCDVPSAAAWTVLVGRCFEQAAGTIPFIDTAGHEESGRARHAAESLKYVLDWEGTTDEVLRLAMDLVKCDEVMSE